MVGRKKAEPGKGKPLLVSVSFRLPPRMKYAAELIARAQHRSVAGVVEWAIERALSDQMVDVGGKQVSLDEVARRTWSPIAEERVKKLSEVAPHLCTFEEEMLVRERKAEG